jgi:hypothetical protein
MIFFKKDEIEKAYKFYKLIKIQIINQRDVLEFLRRWRENLSGEREKGERNGRQRQTIMNIETRLSSSGRGYRDLLNTVHEGGVWLLDIPTRCRGSPHTSACATQTPTMFLIIFNIF